MATSFDDYKLVTKLHGHTASIQVLAVNKVATLMASGGKVIIALTFTINLMNYLASDGIKIWDLDTLSLLMSLPTATHIRGPVTCLTWIRGTTREIICYGTAKGWLVSCSATNAGVGVVILF
jgi:hypothetical protein